MMPGNTVHFYGWQELHPHQHRTNDALQLAEKSLIKNYHSNTARHLKAALLRKTVL